MNWFKNKKVGAHCNKNETRRDFEGQSTCGECKTNILITRAPTRTCLNDGASLEKEHVNEIIIDRCPTCKGVWLDKNELEAIREAAHNEGVGIGMIL